MAAAASLPSLLLLLLAAAAALPAPSYGWGVDGHLMVCQIAQVHACASLQTPFCNLLCVLLKPVTTGNAVQGRLSDAAAAAVKDLLPSYAGNNLSSLCSWADDVKFRYHWSSPLHYIDTPDGLCTYSYDRDCKDEDGVKGRCVAGAINNYTSQLLTYGGSSAPQYNLTQALLFLSHFIGDIHQVWDANIIQTTEDDFYGTGVADYIDALTTNITGEWSEQVPSWEECGKNQTACPDIYASESITAACNWAYKGVDEDSTLDDAYFSSRLPVVNLRLAQGGVRLAATLNRIFG
ncbi:hypothetical protein HU200_020818 [Digitaria exilis]|uniref:Aspergillus nuclease S1 n=1 Tax=Digitaria exilis TaxID=1010633 RepID=A0A835F0H4_9POAL|nr:hypothetical protein HU200_020818 [Digitaria exilis]